MRHCITLALILVQLIGECLYFSAFRKTWVSQWKHRQASNRYEQALASVPWLRSRYGTTASLQSRIDTVAFEEFLKEGFAKPLCNQITHSIFEYSVAYLRLAHVLVLLATSWSQRSNEQGTHWRINGLSRLQEWVAWRTLEVFKRMTSVKDSQSSQASNNSFFSDIHFVRAYSIGSKHTAVSICLDSFCRKKGRLVNTGGWDWLSISFLFVCSVNKHKSSRHVPSRNPRFR